MTNSVYKLMFALLAAVMPWCDLFGDDTPHSHSPIVHRSRPVIERLPLRVVDPVDVNVSEFGETLVADRVGKAVFRVDARGEASLLGQNFENLSRLAYVKSYGAHALLSGKGSGHIVRMTEGGQQSEIHLPFKAVGLGVDLEGNMVTADAANGNVWKINGEDRSILRKLGEPARDLVVDSFGTPIVLLKSGRLVSVFSTTNSTEGYLPRSTRRIEIGRDSGIVGLAYDATNRPVLLHAGSKPDEYERFGSVPQGTSAFAFDKLGNLTLANPDARAITRVTSHFKIPCPHCGQKIDLLFSPDAPLPNDNQSLSSF